MKAWLPRISTVAGTGISTLIFLATVFAVGRVGAGRAIDLLEATLPTIRFLCSSAIAASSTVLALMLTLLSLTEGSEEAFQEEHFERLRRVASLCVVAMIVGIGLLLFMCVPIGEAGEFTQWYEAIYYVTLVTASALGGMLVAIVLLLRTALLGLIRFASPHLSADGVAEAADAG